MRTSATGIVLDLTSQGATQITVAAGAGPNTLRFTMPAPKYDARGNYPRAEGIVVKVSAVIANDGEGDIDIPWDELFQIVQSFRTYCPLLGTLHEPDVFTGPVAKHVIEYLSLGGRYYGNVLSGVAAAEASQTVDLYFFLPFTQESFVDPLGFCPWVGWLTQLELSVTLGPSTSLIVASAGATVGNVTVSAWIQATPTKRLVLPSISQWRGYFPPAAGGSQALLQDVGAQGGLTCVSPGSRVVAILEMCELLGLGGAAMAGDYTSFSMDQLSQPVTQNLDSFIAQYLALYGRTSGPRVFPGTLAVDSISGNPYTMNAIANDPAGAAAVSARQMFWPWRVPGQLAEIGSQPKFQGNLTMFRTFTAAPTAGNFPIVTNEVRDLSEGSAVALLRTAGVDQGRINGMKRDYFAGNPDSKASGFGIPITVPNR
jgi:hypothetical protein